jgi:hypothetical protein
MDRRARTAGAGKRRYVLRSGAMLPDHGQGPLDAPKPCEGVRAAEASGSPAGQSALSTVDDQSGLPSAPIKPLSARAQNTLKELAIELTGEQPPKGTWAPSRELLMVLTAERLGRARNCGPQTIREIIAWAQASGVTIKPALQGGRSLPEMWGRLVAKASAGALTTAEVVEALEKSIRRKSVRIPIAFQLVLLQILLSISE